MFLLIGTASVVQFKLSDSDSYLTQFATELGMQFDPFYKVTILTVCVLLLLAAGCASAIPRRTIKLDALEDGKTLKETVILELGPPSGTFEGERIISYRLGKKQDTYFILDPQTEGEIKRGGGVGSWITGVEGIFDLVLIFDKSNILQKRSVGWAARGARERETVSFPSVLAVDIRHTSWNRLLNERF